MLKKELKFIFNAIFLLSISTFVSGFFFSWGKDKSSEPEAEPVITFPCPATTSFQMHAYPVDAEKQGPKAWTGYLFLKEFPRAYELTLHLTFAFKGKVKVDAKKGEVLKDKEYGRHFSIKFYHTLDRDYVQFRVENYKWLILWGSDVAPPITSIILDDIEICAGSPSIMAPDPNPTTPLYLGAFGPPLSPLLNVPPEDSDNVEAEDCGRRMLRNSPLITHGYGSQPGEWPWHAAIYHRRGSNLIYKCGGVLISETVVLTAAHCLLENGLVITPERLLVQLGKHNLNTARPETRDLEVYQLRVHQNFSQSDLSDDLALLKLAQQAERSDFIQPVCLWPANETDLAPLVLGGEAGYVAGWGMTETGSSPNELQEGRMPVVDYMTCLESNRDFFGAVLNGRNFCAGYRNGTNACNGDSGSGMFFKDKESGRWRMRGIVSVGTVRRAKDICDPLNYVVFTDVARYGDWIKKYI